MILHSDCTTDVFLDLCRKNRTIALLFLFPHSKKIPLSPLISKEAEVDFQLYLKRSSKICSTVFSKHVLKVFAEHQHIKQFKEKIWLLPLQIFLPSVIYQFMKKAFSYWFIKKKNHPQWTHNKCRSLYCTTDFPLHCMGTRKNLRIDVF